MVSLEWQLGIAGKVSPFVTFMWWIFIFCVLAILYTWVGYGFMLKGLSWVRKAPIHSQPYFPLVTVIVAARNEESNIEHRLRNLLELDYPPHCLEIIVGSDGSKDRTAAIVQQIKDPRIQVFKFSESRGRASVHNDAVQRAHGEVLIFTDAATRFDPSFLRTLIPNFADAKVGCVSGVIEFGNREASEISRKRGLYWRYEYWLRRLESKCGILVCASGPCMAVRKTLFRPLENGSYDVDFMTPLDVVQAGSLVLQEDNAIAYDEMFSTPRQELRAQARMVSRNLAGYADRQFLLTRYAYFPLAWSLISHKILRWGTPLILLGAFLANGALAFDGHLRVCWLLQILFYLTAVLGWLITRSGREMSFFSAPFAFCLANLGFLLGILKALRSQRIVVY